MRPCVLIFLGLLSTTSVPAADSRDTAYDSLRDDARVTSLVAAVSNEIKAHRYDEALKKANEAEALQPGNSVVLNAKGAALTELRRFDEASKILDAAVAADPKAFPPQFNQGELLFLQKKYSDAAGQFLDVRTRFGVLPILKFKLYLCYALAGQKDSASDALSLMSYPQDDAAWYFAHAVDNLLAGKSKEAARLIKVAQAINPDGSAIYYDTLHDAGLLK